MLVDLVHPPIESPRGISPELLKKIIPGYEMMETGTNLFTLARLNPIHQQVALSTEQFLYRPQPLERVRILDLGCDNMFPIKPTLDVLNRAGIPADIIGVDINPAKLNQARQRPELMPYFDEKNPVRIHLKEENGEQLSLEDSSCDEVRLIGVLDGTIHGDPAAILKEMHRVLKPNGVAKITFRSPYLDRLLPAIERAGNHILWNGESEEILDLIKAKMSPLQKGYPLSRKQLIGHLIDLGFSSVTYFGQLPIRYTNRIINHGVETAEEYSFLQTPHLKAFIYNGQHFIIPHEDYCKLEKQPRLDLRLLGDMKTAISNETLFQTEIDKMLGRENNTDAEVADYSQHMFWYAEIEK